MPGAVVPLLVGAVVVVVHVEIVRVVVDVVVRVRPDAGGLVADVVPVADRLDRYVAEEPVGTGEWGADDTAERHRSPVGARAALALGVRDEDGVDLVEGLPVLGDPGVHDRGAQGVTPYLYVLVRTRGTLVAHQPVQLVDPCPGARAVGNLCGVPDVLLDVAGEAVVVPRASRAADDDRVGAVARSSRLRRLRCGRLCHRKPCRQQKSGRRGRHPLRSHVFLPMWSAYGSRPWQGPMTSR